MESVWILEQTKVWMLVKWTFSSVIIFISLQSFMFFTFLGANIQLM